jgi:hypothetical protein
MRWPKSSSVWAATRFGAVFVVLVAPWPGMGRSFAAAYAPIATAIAWPALLTTNDVAVHMGAAPENDRAHGWDLMVWVNDAKTGKALRFAAIKLRRGGYLQMIFFIALVVGWPGRDPRRLALVLGAGLMCLSIFASLPIFVFLAKRDFIHLGALSQSALAIACRSLVAAPGMMFAVPWFLWLLLARPFDRPALAFLKRLVVLPEKSPSA